MDRRKEKRQHYAANREKILKRQAEQQATKRKARTEAERKRRAANPERWREAARQYYQRNRGVILARERQRRAAADTHAVQ
jgi:hypothetical protein